MTVRFFRSVVARRIFLLFVTCALAPVTALAIISSIRVTRQLEQQSAARLRQGSKMVGMAMLERLQMLEQRLTLWSSGLAVPAGRGDTATTTAALLRDFEAVAFQTGSATRVLRGQQIDQLAPVTASESEHLAAGRSLLRTTSNDGSTSLFLGHRAEVAGRTGVLWARLDPTFLWSAGIDAKPPETEFCVLPAVGNPFYCSHNLSQSGVASLRAHLAQHSGDLEYRDDGSRYLGAHWSVFLRFGYGASDWTVVLVQSRRSVLAPIAGFRSMFAYTTLVVMLGVFLLSSVQIRRNLQPLDELRVGIHRVANRDFGTPVTVKSGDEFETVAASFNEMTGQLQAQFNESERLNAALRVTTDDLAERSARLSTILDTAADGILVVNDAEVIESMNTTALAMFGCGAEPVVGLPLETFLPGVSLERSPLSCTGHRRSSEEFPVELTAKRTAVDGRGVTVVMVRDVSERVAAEQERELLERQLRQAQKMETIGTLAGGIAHDFNNILSPIVGYVELTLMDVDPTSEIHENLDHVRLAARRAKDLVRQILSFSRQTEQEATVVTLRVIVHEALRLLKASLPATIQIEERYDDGQATVVADPTQLHQVAMNLCTNAYHAMRETGGVLRVGISSVHLDESPATAGTPLDPGEYACLTVSDTGTGMEPSTLERIFEPFFTTKGPQEGTGLGLSVVHGIIHDHGGSITVDSVLGQGSTFTVYLPRVISEATTTTTEESMPTGCHGRVMVVDDDAQIVRVQARMLERSGYEVTSAVGSVKALECFESTPAGFDLVVTDHTMPHMTGVALAKEMWTIRPELPVILTSGFGDGLTEESIRAEGFATFLRKPIRPVELARAVEMVMSALPGAARRDEAGV